MTRVAVGAVLRDKLQNLSEPLELCYETGDAGRHRRNGIQRPKCWPACKGISVFGRVELPRSILA